MQNTWGVMVITNQMQSIFLPLKTTKLWPVSFTLIHSILRSSRGRGDHGHDDADTLFCVCMRGCCCPLRVHLIDRPLFSFFKLVTHFYFLFGLQLLFKSSKKKIARSGCLLLCVTGFTSLFF